MRELAQAQAASGLYRAVGFGLITDHTWPVEYGKELEETGLRFYRASTRKMFGTAQFLWQRWQPPPIAQWVADFASKPTNNSSSPIGWERAGVRVHGGGDEPRLHGERRPQILDASWGHEPRRPLSPTLSPDGGEGEEQATVVVHFHNAWLSGVFLPLRVPGPINVRTVATFHGVNVGLERKPVRKLLHRWMARRLVRFGAGLTSVDAVNLDLAWRILRLEPNRFTVIPNGVPGHNPPPTKPWDGTGEFVVGCLGSVAEIKGWRLAAEAVLKLAQQGRRVRLVIAGTGPEQEEARRLATEHPGVIEYRGHVRNPGRNFFPQVHLLSVMSVHEGLPMNLIEAMAAGVPAVATKVGGVPEIITDGLTGFLVARRLEPLMGVISDLYDHPEKLPALRRQARQRFEERFDIRQIAQQYDRVYTETR